MKILNELQIKLYECYQLELLIITQTNEIQRIIDAAKRAVSVYPTHQSYYELCLNSYKLFIEKEEPKYLKEAIEFGEKGLKLKGNYYKLLVLMGSCVINQEDYERSNEYYKKALACGFRNAEVLSRIAKNL